MAKSKNEDEKRVEAYLIGKYETTRIGFLRLHLSTIKDEKLVNSIIDLNADREDWEGLIEEIRAIVDNMEDEEDDDVEDDEEDGDED